jgi:hypothetical protein
VLRGRDDDRRAAALECPQQVVGHPFCQFLVVTVELNDMTTDVQVFSAKHRFSIGDAPAKLAPYLPDK